MIIINKNIYNFKKSIILSNILITENNLIINGWINY